MTLVFLDTETTSLRHDRRAWEIALITRDEDSVVGDAEYRWFIDLTDLDLGNADLHSLRIGGFHERHPQAARAAGLDPATAGSPDSEDLDQEPYGEAVVLRDLEATFLRGVTIVGAVPWFDTDVLGQRMRANGLCPSWHYHLVDVETLAAGALGAAPPWNFDALLKAYGLAYNEADRHTALGDARMVRDLYDAVLDGTREANEM